MAIDNTIHDPSIEGTSGLRGLNRNSNLGELIPPIPTLLLRIPVPDFSSAEGYLNWANYANQYDVPITEIGANYEGLGESVYDLEITSLSQLDNLPNTRGELQPWYSLLGNGLAKAGILAGTTFLDGVIGLPVGILTAIGEGRISGVWNNPVSRALKEVNDNSENWLPNYYTDAELNDNSFWENLATTNFWGDKFIKNLGFTVGAFGSGNLFAKGLKATKLPELLGVVMNNSTAPAIVTSGLGATVSAINEGRIEALNNSTDWYETLKLLIDELYSDRLNQVATNNLFNPIQAQRDLANEELIYNETLTKLKEDLYKMGNVDLMLNLPILTFSNAILFGKLYANGFNTARRASRIVGSAGNYSVSNPSRALGIARAVLNPLSEGAEEVAQGIAANTSGIKYENDALNFYKSKINPDAELLSIDWLQAFGQGIAKSMDDEGTFEEFFIGTLTGALGMPRFRGFRNSDGRILSPVTIEGGILGSLRESVEETERNQLLADRMNAKVNSPEFLNYYRGLIRHNAYLNQMDNAVMSDSEFDFKNAEYALLVSDVAMFDNAGRLEDFLTLTESAFDTSDANLQAIVENTSSQTENGDTVGPFINSNGNPMYSTPEGKQEMIEKLTLNRDALVEAVNEYISIKNNIDQSTGLLLTDELLEELTFLRGLINNWTLRKGLMASEVTTSIGNVIGSLAELLLYYDSVVAEEGLNPSLTDAYREAEELSNKIRLSMNVLNNLRNASPEVLSFLLALNPKMVTTLKNAVEENPNATLDEVNNFNRKVDDLVRVQKALDTYKTKLKEYLTNPLKLQSDIDNATESTARTIDLNQRELLKNNLEASNNMDEFREAIDAVDNNDLTGQVIATLDENGYTMALEYTLIQNYGNNLKLSTGENEVLNEIIDDAISRALTKEDLLNIDFYNIESATGSDLFSADQLTEIVSNLSNIIGIANLSSQVAGSLKPAPSAEPSPVVTGLLLISPTIPRVEPPVGNITLEQATLEIIELNNQPEAVLPTTGSTRPYYRPVIPELSIEASRQGDFRPFNQVVRETEGLDFDLIYNYLRDNGAFNYVNSRNLRVGDEIGFMVDPNFNDHTIFMVAMKPDGSYLIVGSLDESATSTARYTGLLLLRDKVLLEYNASPRSDRFIATPKTRVSKMMIGKIPYSSTENNLGSIPGVSGTSIFGIVKNGVLNTNGKLTPNEVVSPLNMANKEGRMYLLIPSPDGKYRPAAVRVKHFDSSYISDPLNLTKPLFTNIMKALEKLTTSDLNTINDIVSELGRNLYIGRLHIDAFSSKYGNGIRISNPTLDENGREVYNTVDGNRVRQEEVRTIYFNTLTAEGTTYIIKEDSMVVNEIRDAFASFNLPIQVNLGLLNKSLYNLYLLNSDVLTSNILEARVIGNWFITDYFDSLGNLQSGISPSYNKPEVSREVETPVGGKESVVEGTLITYEGALYFIKDNIVRDSEGNRIDNNSKEAKVLKKLAYVLETYGNSMQGVNMINGIVLMPDNTLFNRVTGETVEDESIRRLLTSLANTPSNLIEASILENQKKVDRNRTDNENYYILEDDGLYHPYKRVHTILGNNWLESELTTNTIRDIRAKLTEYSSNPTLFINYITSLERGFNVNLSLYKTEPSAIIREGIISTVRDSITGTNSLRALEAGSSIDTVVRLFFSNDNTTIPRPSNMSENAYNKLIDSLTLIKENMLARGERFLTNNVVVFHKFPDGTKVAGELDILAVDNEGRFKIYDIKTSRYSFEPFQRSGTTVDYFRTQSSRLNMSTYLYYTNLLSAYKSIFEGLYNTPVSTLAILPFVLTYEGNTVSDILRLKGIPITYNPLVLPINPSISNNSIEEAPSPVLSQPAPVLLLNSSMSEVELAIRSAWDFSLGNSLLYSDAISRFLDILYDYGVGYIGNQNYSPTLRITQYRKILEYLLDNNIPELNLFRGFFNGLVILSEQLLQDNSLSISTLNTTTVLPIFNHTIAELQNPTDLTLEPNNQPYKGDIGYYIKEGLVVKNWLLPIGEVEGKLLHIAREVTMSTGLGNDPFISRVDYYVVFPNGKSIKMISPDNPLDTVVEGLILNAMKGNPSRVISESSESTVLNSDQSPISNTASLALASINSIRTPNSRRRKPSLRRVDTVNRRLINLELELEWLSNVLPESVTNKVEVVRGLIQVALNGPVAWGLFNNGIITLSDIAAEGTVYHEAFHAVFLLMLNNNEKLEILALAKQRFGNLNNVELEERLAEEFREYVQGLTNRNLGLKILDFFSSVYNKIINWGRLQPSLLNYYQRINNGYYSNNNMEVIPLSEIRNNLLLLQESNIITSFAELTDSLLDSLIERGFANDKFNSLSSLEKEHLIRCI